MRDQYSAPAEYGSPTLLVELGPVNVSGIYGFRMPNAVDWRSIHHHYTGLGKAHMSCETVHDFWVRARVYIDTFLNNIWLGLNTVNTGKLQHTFAFAKRKLETNFHDIGLLHYKKRLTIFLSPDGMSLTKLSLTGNNLIFPGQGRVW